MNGQAYAPPRPDDRLMISTYGIPVPPSPASLLEGHRQDHYTSHVKHSEHLNFSPLLDTNDVLGMRLLLSSAATDAQKFKILSLEEVERLKRERSLLRSRIDAHIRKLALESKVRDASENLVKLHAQKNKRLSRQADEQLQSASRKVEDLATDLWRLQRRESAIKEQLLEHMAGVLAQNVASESNLSHATPLLDFDEAHLYVDSSTLMESIDIALDRNTKPAEQKTSVELSVATKVIVASQRELHGVLLELNTLAHPEEQNGHNESTAATKTLQETVADVQSVLIKLRQKQSTQDRLLSDAIAAHNAVKRQIWDTIQDEVPSDISDSALLQKLSLAAKDLRRLQYEMTEHKARSSDLEEQHALAMKSLQAEYERELDDAHVELDGLRELQDSSEQDRLDSETHQRELTTVKTSYEKQLKSLSNDLQVTKQSLSDLTTRNNAMSQEKFILTDLKDSLEVQVGNLQAELVSKNKTQRTDNETAQQKINNLEDLLQRLSAEIATHRDRHEVRDRELQEQKDVHLSEKALSAETLSKQTTRLDGALATIEQLEIEITQTKSSHKSLEEQLQGQIEALRQQLGVAKAKAEQYEDDHSGRQKEIDQSLLDAKQESQQMSMLLNSLTLELESANKERTLQDASYHQLENELLFAKQELGALQERNLELFSELEKTKQGVVDSSTVHNLQSRCELLQTELNAMLVEFEALTRSSVAFESERTRLEDRSDELLNRVLDLETLVAEERVKNMGQRSAASDDAPVSPLTGSNENATSANLRKEFRKLIQEMRTQHAKKTRSDYAEIKRLERLLASTIGGSVLSMAEP